MKKTVLMSAVLAIAGVGLMAGSAMALPVDFEMGSNSDIEIFGNGPSLFTAANITGNVASEQFTLDVNEFYSFDFAYMGSVSFQPNLSQNVTAWLDFDLPNNSDVSVPGTVYGFQGSYQSGHVTWNDPVSISLLNGISFSVELSDTDFVYEVLPIGDAIQIGMGYGKVVATVTLTGDGSGHVPVPEPATMLLFGTGLIGLAGAARRKKAQKK